MTETRTPIDILDGINAESGEVAKWILPLIFPDLSARTLQEKGNQHLLQDNVARLAGNLQAVTSNVAAFSEALQMQWQAIAVLARGQGQVTNDVRGLQALIQSIVAGVTDVAREQAATRGAMQDGAKVMSTATEALQQGQRALQGEVDKMADVTRQTSAALAATAAEQTAVHETVKHVKEEVTGVTARQAALGEVLQAHGQAMATATATLAGDVRRLQELTQTVVGGVADLAREQAAVRGAVQDSTRVMGTSTEALQQGQRTLQTELEKVADATRQTGAALAATAAEQTAVHETVNRVKDQVTGVAAEQTAVHETVNRVKEEVTGVTAEQTAVHDTVNRIKEEVTGVAAEQTTVRETVTRVREEVTGIAAKQAALSEAVQAHEQNMAAATATLAGGQGQLAGDVRQLQELTQTLVGGVADVTREQAAVRGAVQDSAKVIGATTETIQQGQRALQAEMEKMADATKQTGAALTATAAEQAAVRSALQDSARAMSATSETIQQGQRTLQAEMEKMADATKQIIASVNGTANEQAAVRSALQDSTKVIGTTAETIQQGLRALQAEVDKMVETMKQTIASVTTAATEQATVRSAMQDSTKVMSTTAEAIQEGQRALQAEIDKMVETTKQTIASLTVTAAEQTSGQEMTRRMIGEVANAAMAALALGHGPLPGDVPQPQNSTQTIGDVRPVEVRPPAPTEESNKPQRLPAAMAVTHGEQIRYEVGPDRDNLGCWTNASDWAEWELDIARPGRFKVAAEIAAVASARFQVVLGDRQLDGSAPNTGDYGRFQEIELGIVELTSSGKTHVAVRPVAEGWQPMNLKALALVPLN